MDSDLTGKHEGRTFADALASQAMQRPWPDRVLAHREVVMTVEEAEAAAKAQRRADLVTLVAAALSGNCANPQCFKWDDEFMARRSVAAAEAALDLITERTK